MLLQNPAQQSFPERVARRRSSRNNAHDQLWRTNDDGEPLSETMIEVIKEDGPLSGRSNQDSTSGCLKKSF